MDMDQNRIDDAVLALLWLNFESVGVAWKGFDWSAMERFEGQRLFQMLFAKSNEENSS